jgi:acetyl esterase/lipase
MVHLLVGIAIAQSAALPPKTTYATKLDVGYRNGRQDSNMAERCKLDIYYPLHQTGFATVVWFHGGGLTGGSKEIPERLKEQGFAVVAPEYRLSPTVKCVSILEDAAAAVAWVVKNMPQYGASPSKLFISGHSAGGYLADMLVLDKRWLKPYGIDPDSFAGLAPFSGQCITHFTVRKERGIPELQAQVDDLAPLFYVRKDAPPILLLTGDREKELYGRYEETAYFWRMLKLVGHPSVQLLELQGYDHGGMPDPGFPLLSQFVKDRCKQVDSAGR